MSGIGRYIWASDVRKNPNGIISFFERAVEKLGAIERFNIDVACFDFKTKKEYAVYIRPDRAKRKGNSELMNNGDNMCLKMGNDVGGIAEIANQIHAILSKKYSCAGQYIVTDATDPRRYYANKKVTPLTFPLAEGWKSA